MCCRQREEKETAGVRNPMPPSATNQYIANAAPKTQPNACRIDPFIERQWNVAFVWVQIPEVGNDTLAEDFAAIGNGPPDNAAARKVLAEVLGGDTVAASAAEMGQSI
jgi:hypothetical protein